MRKQDRRRIRYPMAIPRIVRHFNYSIKESRSYDCITVSKNTSDSYLAKTRYIQQMYAKANGIQIGKLFIYFSDVMPIGLYHPEIGPLCLDNLWTRQTAYCLNRINGFDDERLSLYSFYKFLNKYLKQELSGSIKLYIPDVSDRHIRKKIDNNEMVDYIQRSKW